MAENIIISGAGISGLLYALLLTEKGHGDDINIIDKAPEAGGLLRRFHYGEYGDFDYGAHNLLETGIKDFDALLLSLLPAEKWITLDGNRREIAGSFYQGSLHTHTPFIELQDLPNAASFIDAFHRHIDSNPRPSTATARNAEEVALSQFGPEVARAVTLPALEKIFQKPASELAPMAMSFAPLSRIALPDSIPALQASADLRTRVAWPDQRTLPAEYASGKRAFYPKHYGMFRIIDAIVKRLHDAGVQLHLNTEVTGVNTEGDRISHVHLRHAGEESTLTDIARMVWTTNIPLLARYLAIDFTGVAYDKPLRTVLANLLLDAPATGMKDVYYAYCLDAGYHTYRVTHYSNFCPGAVRNGLYPVCLEMLMEDAVAAAGNLDAIARDELRRMSIMASGNQIRFSQVEVLDAGFPMPSVKNMQGLYTLRERIQDRKFSNLEMIGIMAKDGLFFQTDVIADVYRTLHP